MLHAAIARPEKIAALVGIAVAADHIVSTFQQLPLEVRTNIDLVFKCKYPHVS